MQTHTYLNRCVLQSLAYVDNKNADVVHGFVLRKQLRSPHVGKTWKNIPRLCIGPAIARVHLLFSRHNESRRINANRS
jgi:hypothetical protein